MANRMKLIQEFSDIVQHRGQLTKQVNLLQKDVESLQNDKGAQAAIIRRMKKHDPRVINAVSKIHY